MEAMKAIPLELEADHVLQSEETVNSTANYLPVTMLLGKLWLYHCMTYIGKKWDQYN